MNFASSPKYILKTLRPVTPIRRCRLTDRSLEATEQVSRSSSAEEVVRRRTSDRFTSDRQFNWVITTSSRATTSGNVRVSIICADHRQKQFIPTDAAANDAPAHWTSRRCKSLMAHLRRCVDCAHSLLHQKVILCVSGGRAGMKYLCRNVSRNEYSYLPSKVFAKAPWWEKRLRGGCVFLHGNG